MLFPANFLAGSEKKKSNRTKSKNTKMAYANTKNIQKHNQG